MIRLPRLLEILGISRSSYYDWSNPKSPRYDATLPKKYSLGVKSVGWRLDEALSWVENKSAVEGR
ncbi:MAG: AlpA family phage regulatory protein [Pseudomonadales bacterium]|nr:AlpA family phage regulatory protein [Pseudomonadales bacterium]